MTVKELIEELNKYPDYWHVEVRGDFPLTMADLDDEEENEEDPILLDIVDISTDGSLPHVLVLECE